MELMDSLLLFFFNLSPQLQERVQRACFAICWVLLTRCMHDPLPPP
jgi:hypothetical protein